MPFLLVIPSLDIQDGKMVRVVQGIPELDVHEYSNDPVAMARIWRTENARMLHVVDFNAFKDHSTVNRPLLEEICESVIIPVQYAGGIRSVADADTMISLGVSRIVITTMLVENRAGALTILEKYGPGKVVAGLDVVRNEIVIHNRKVHTGLTPEELAEELSRQGFDRFVVTDVRRNGMLGGPNIDLSIRVAEASGKKVTLSGGIRNKDELNDISLLKETGIDSVIVGRALYENRFPCQKLWRKAEEGLFD